MLHTIRFLGALRVVETIQGAHKVPRNTADALEFHTFAYKNFFIRHANTFHFLISAD